ncbi:MAG: mannose-6-phosphate isomerase, class I [Corynebacteriales bacterium]|nr:mannose-6-phosphate isomerase, class I [Mycobacteriales bacterium]
MELLSNTIQHYAWGSHEAIAEVQGRETPSAKPEAELWMGAHPSASSRCEDGRTLRSIITVDPVNNLGAATHKEFGPRLPYLMKLLAAAAPLSIQVHPDANQAAEGFIREEDAGIHCADPKRNYVDSNHKPELLCAITEFEALCGFRPLGQSRDLLAGLRLPELENYCRQLDEPGGLQRVVTDILTDQEPHLIARAVGAACIQHLDNTQSPYAVAARIAQRYPGDIGVVVALLLNHLRLQPGQALYVPAGVPHAYLGGTGIEVMANSDNVLRAGLTPKHVDVSEVLRVLSWDAGPPALVKSHNDGAGLEQWSTPAREFVLFRAQLADRRLSLPVHGARIVFCLHGAVQLHSADNSIDITAGQAAYVPDVDGDIALTGSGTAFVAGTH